MVQRSVHCIWRTSSAASGSRERGKPIGKGEHLSEGKKLLGGDWTNICSVTFNSGRSHWLPLLRGETPAWGEMCATQWRLTQPHWVFIMACASISLFGNRPFLLLLSSHIEITATDPASFPANSSDWSLRRATACRSSLANWRKERLGCNHVAVSSSKSPNIPL